MTEKKSTGAKRPVIYLGQGPLYFLQAKGRRVYANIGRSEYRFSVKEARKDGGTPRYSRSTARAYVFTFLQSRFAGARPQEEALELIRETFKR